jgi:hypothetical protein
MLRYATRGAVLLTVAACIAAGVASAGESTFTDPAGDSGTAPDLTSVTVGDAGGLLVFKIAGTPVPSSEITIWLDTDRNRTTGDQGFDVQVGVGQEPDGSKYWFSGRWNVSAWQAFDGLAVIAMEYPDRIEIGFTASQAGITGGFDFELESEKLVGDAVEADDYAPEGILPWSYTPMPVEQPAAPAPTSSKAVRATIGKPAIAPLKLHAGKLATVRFAVSWKNGEEPDELTVGCVARYGTKAVKAVGAMGDGTATCKVRLPATPKQGTLRGSISVAGNGLTAKRTYSFPVR